MGRLYNFTREQKLFAAVFLLGIIVKYNYMLLKIFYVPSITGVILLNLILITFVIVFLFPLIKKLRGRTVLFVFFTVFTLLFLGNFWYGRYFGDYLSYTDMTMGQGVEGLNPVKVFLFQIVKFQDIIFLIDLCLLGFLLRRIGSKKYSFDWGREYGGRKIKFAGGIFILLLFVAQIVVVGGFMETRNPAELYAHDTAGFVNTYGIMSLYGFEFYHVAFSENSPVEDREITVVDSESEFDGRQIVSDKTNIIVIQVESLDEKIIGYEHGGEVITPFLKQLKEETRYYPRFYAQHVNGSFDAEFSFLTSLYPANKNYVFREYDMSNFTSVIDILNDGGYNTLAFHGNDRTFFHRHKAYSEFGFDRFYSKKDINPDTERPLGVNDREFFSASLDFLEDEEEPYFAYFITVTSHTPFDFYPEEEFEDKFSDVESRFVRDYFRSINYTDGALEMFFAGLEERGILENSVVILYGDHGAGVEREEYQSGGEFVQEEKVKEPEHIPLFIKYPDVEPQVDNKLGTPVDLAPTILDMLGEKVKPDDFAGNSLLQAGEEPVIFLHEQPQVLYRDGLFVRGLEGFEQVGNRRGTEDRNVQLPDEKQTRVERLIEECRAIFYEIEE